MNWQKGKYIVPIIATISLLLNIYFAFNLYYHPPSVKTDFIATKVSNIIDGDTFDMANGERIRLYGIDTPEYPKGCLGEDAKNRLETLIFDELVSTRYLSKDAFGRQVSLVYINDLLINEILVEEGLAYYEKSKPITAELLTLERAEDKAKKAGRGVWSTLCETKKEGCLIKGNYRQADNTRLYHTPDCYNYDRITIKPGTTDRWFCTEKEATAAGFIKSKDCP